MGETEIEIVRTSLHRGRFSGGEVELRSGAPFGLVNSTRLLEVASEMIVVPRGVVAEPRMPKVGSGTPSRDQRTRAPVQTGGSRGSSRRTRWVLRQQPPEHPWDATWAFLVVPQDDGGCRLLAWDGGVESVAAALRDGPGRDHARGVRRRDRESGHRQSRSIRIALANDPSAPASFAGRHTSS